MSQSPHMAVQMIRRSVPNDHSCLFSAVAYLAEGGHRGGVVATLRQRCAEAVGADPDRYSDVILGVPAHPPAR